MNKIEKLCRKHFNEPVITSLRVGRLIGYAEDNMDCYYIILYPQDRGEVWESAVGPLMTLRSLLTQDVVLPSNDEFRGQVWSNFSRLDNWLSSNGAPRAKEFKLDLRV